MSDGRDKAATMEILLQTFLLHTTVLTVFIFLNITCLVLVLTVEQEEHL